MASWPINKRVRGRPAAGAGSGGGGEWRNRQQESQSQPQPERTGPAAAAAAAVAAGGNESGGGRRQRRRPVERRRARAIGGAVRPRARAGTAAETAIVRTRGSAGGPSRSSVALAPPPPLEPLHVEPTLGAPQVFPAEVAANRRRVITLCAVAAVLPALLLGALVWVTLSMIVGVVVFVVAGAAVMYALWRLAPSVARNRIGAVPIDEQDETRLWNVTEGLCATFGLSMPTLYVLDDDVPNACALGHDARRSVIVVTTGLLRRLDPIELEGVIAHELAHVKRGDNGVSCIGITLARIFGGSSTLRRCVGESREYRADVVGASAVRFPRGLLGALRTMMAAPAPTEGSFFASPARFGPTRWVWIDPSVGHRDEVLLPGDLDATSVRAAALSEW